MNESDNHDEAQFIYWEKQGKDRMCGLHWLNSLVQGPLFNESSLFNVAQDLDKLEKSIMEDAGIPQNANEGTNNISDDGNYNIQVLTKSIENIGNYELVSIDKPGVRAFGESLAGEQGFLWNSVDHWFAIRKVHDTWLNLNSTNIEPGPQIISDFYLDAFLESVKDAGYTIYTVRGDNLPIPHKEEYHDSLRKNQFFIGLNYLKMHYEGNKNRKLNVDGADESELEAAIKASLDDVNNQHQFPGHLYQDNTNYALLTGAQPEEDDELAKAIAMSLAQDANMQNQNEEGSG